MQKENGLLKGFERNKLSFPRNVVGNLPHTWLLCKKEKSLYLSRYEEDPRVLRTAKSGMTANFNNGKSGRSRIKCGMTTHVNKGFTLIELLVVVLIIGILAAIALPQYQKAVEKSKAAQAMTLLKALGQATQAYYLANGTYPTKFDELAVDIPWTGTQRWHDSPHVKDTKSNDDWSAQIYNNGAGDFMLFVGRISGMYAGAGFAAKEKVWCVEDATTNNVFSFSKPKGSYCEKLFHGTSSNSQTDMRYYILP